MYRKLIKAAAAAAVIMTLAACGSTTAGSSSGGAAAENKKVTYATIAGWNDNLDTANLFKYVLEKNGYSFNIKELSEIATVYAGAAGGSVDAFSSAPTSIHKVYWDKYQSSLQDPGAYYDNGSIYMAVPDYVTDVKSIADLNAHAAEFDGTIYGIEPGSGLVATTKDKVFPAYDLGKSFQLQTSSTAAMLATLKKATDAKKPVVVTIWAPWWVNTGFPVRKLEDPQKAYGEPYSYHIVMSKKFAESSPAASKMMASLKLTDQQFNTLDDAIYNQFKPGEEQKAVASWAEKNPDVIQNLESYLKKS